VEFLKDILVVKLCSFWLLNFVIILKAHASTVEKYLYTIVFSSCQQTSGVGAGGAGVAPAPQKV